jgi:prepilin-type N-terminal cleavage/methylation domain-containing protein
MRRHAHTTISVGQSGFTLVELMVVVAIIGILAAVAGPRIQQFRARGIQSEAKANLNSIYLAQAAYQDANDAFDDSGDCAEGAPCKNLAFAVNNGARYKYSVAATDSGWAAGASSKQKILKGNRDKWRVNTNKNLCAVKDAVADKTTCDAAMTVADDGKVSVITADNAD